MKVATAGEQMHAAVVTSFDQPPRYLAVPVPIPDDPDHFLVDVLAIGLHPRTRSGAAGAHYSSTGRLPLIPGVDGVGRRADGRLVYFVAEDDFSGTMADRAVVDPRRSIELPPTVDVHRVAAAMNPAMSSWVALRRRISLRSGQRVVILGATGNAGTMAVQVAKLLGAGSIIGVGRDRDRLAALSGLGADHVVTLESDVEATGAALGAVTAEADVVLDYLWGEPAARAMVTMLTARADRSRALDWIQIGSVAGATLPLPSAALRSTNLRLLGSGQGSVSPRAYLAELPALVEQIDQGALTVMPRARPLRDVERVWDEPDAPGARTVLVP
jgi:NADPH:quinone reductase-like Zn-dependent oxidoreductase